MSDNEATDAPAAQKTVMSAKKAPKKTPKGTKGSSSSRSSKAGITFPVGRIHSQLKKRHYAERIGGSVPIYLAGVLEYLAAEVLELAGNAARDNKRTRITPRHIMFAVENDDELKDLLPKVAFTEGGVMPGVRPELLPVRRKKKVVVTDE